MGQIGHTIGKILPREDLLSSGGEATILHPWYPSLEGGPWFTVREWGRRNWGGLKESFRNREYSNREVSVEHLIDLCCNSDPSKKPRDNVPPDRLDLSQHTLRPKLARIEVCLSLINHRMNPFTSSTHHHLINAETQLGGKKKEDRKRERVCDCVITWIRQPGICVQILCEYVDRHLRGCSFKKVRRSDGAWTPNGYYSFRVALLNGKNWWWF